MATTRFFSVIGVTVRISLIVIVRGLLICIASHVACIQAAMKAVGEQREKGNLSTYIHPGEYMRRVA